MPQVWRGRQGRKGNGQLGGSCRLVLSTEAAQRTFLLPAAALQLSVGRTSFISSWELKKQARGSQVPHFSP